MGEADLLFVVWKLEVVLVTVGGMKKADALPTLMLLQDLVINSFTKKRRDFSSFIYTHYTKSFS
jgi:hypothetical protein